MAVTIGSLSLPGRRECLDLSPQLRHAGVDATPIEFNLRLTGAAGSHACSGRAHLTTITVGRNNDVAAEVLEGLAAGDIVITHPSDKITDGVMVHQR